ncbi:hypothetical protein Tco_0219449, partial [Tanacetum coccineum]
SGTQSADVALPRGLTRDLHADVACHLTRPLTGGSATVNRRWLTGGPPVVYSGAPPLTVVDRHWPPLTAIVDRWSGGGSGDGAETVITPRGTTQVVTHGILMIGCQVAGTRIGTRNLTAAND